MKTWKEFEKYCLDNVNENGFIALTKNWLIQVYDNRSQVNICNNGNSWLNVIFSMDNAMLYNCTEPGICNYDVIAEVVPLNYSVHQAPGLNSYARAAIEVIRDLK